MASLADLRAFRDRLIGAVATSTRAVQDSNGERIEYRSVGEIARAIQIINAEIQKAETIGELGCSRIVYPMTSKGL